MADSWGIDHSYADVTGKRHRVGAATIEQLRETIGEPTQQSGPAILTAGEPLTAVGADLVLEDGTEMRVDGAVRDLPLGYHRIIERGCSRPLIVTPGRCHLPAGFREWGWAAQVYATRSSDSWGMGDLGDLASLADWAANLGAGFVLANPMGSVTLTPPIQPSPYSPSSRRFLSPLYLRIDDVPGAGASKRRLAPLASAGRSLNLIREIDRDSVWHFKSQALDIVWHDVGPSAEFESWFATAPPEVRRFGIWMTLTERHGSDWRRWPADVRHPRGAGVARAEHEDGDRVRFHAWLQWLLAEQLARAGDVGAALVTDLTIGVDRAGFDAWDWQDVLALDVSVGAPPDELNRDGQDWGLPPFIPWKLRSAGYQPFIDTIRASLRSAGGLRIDHVMGLFRLWWIPQGASPVDGAFVRNRSDDLLAILALESHRAGAVVVGEDLGTVLTSARRSLAARNVLSYRLLWFEEDPPSAWPPRSMAAVTTHDLPTVAGLWDGSDVATQIDLGLDTNEASFSAMRGRLADPAGLDDATPVPDAVEAAYRVLATAPAAMLTATVDDAIAATERPNIPGADGRRANWSIALPVPLDDIRSSALPHAIADTLNEALERDG